jgi:lipopolysaccharide/colanic/teichoic acid biosynthesis glycosyltransferase
MHAITTAALATSAGSLRPSDDLFAASPVTIHHHNPAAALRRGRDVMLSLLLLFLTLPLLLVVACLIKLESPGPVLYRQERVGLAGRGFSLWKFRSMRTDAEASGPVWAARNDELPQLANVLRGEMSLVGPRPERPVFVGQLVQVLPEFVARTCVPPGLTGWAQVNYPYGASVEDARIKLGYDLYYIRERSLLLDLRILLRTIGVVLRRTGAR